MKKLTVLLFILLTSSCSVSIVHEPTTIKELLPVGSTLHLTKVLDIPADRSYIYIANGKIAPLKNYNTVNIYEPYCMFGFDKESPQARQIMPDQFEVTKVVEWDRYYGGLDYKKMPPANNRRVGFFKAVYFVNDNAAPGIVMYATIISLHSDKQSNVREIVCGHWDDQHVVEPLTLNEMITALGDLIIINKNGFI